MLSRMQSEPTACGNANRKHIYVILLAIICSLTEPFVHTRLNREILQNKYFQYFDRSKTRHDRAKIGLAGQHDRPPFKNYFEP